MPHDDPRFRKRIDKLRAFALHFRTLQSRRRPKRGEPQAGPVEPRKPNTLTGGAAASLEFDD